MEDGYKIIAEQEIIKQLKSALSSKTDKKILKAVKFIEYTLNSYIADEETYLNTCNMFLESDISHFLRESLSTMNYEIITSIFQCWIFFTDTKIFFTQNYAVSAMDATTRCTLFILCKQNNQFEIDLALRVLYRMSQGLIKYNCPLQSDSISVDQIIELITTLLEKSEDLISPIAIKSYELFELLLLLPIWSSSLLTKLYILFDDSIKVLKRAHDEEPTFEVVDRICDLCSSTMRTCSSTLQDIEKSILENTQDTESIKTVEQIIQTSNDLFLNICAPAYLSMACELSPLLNCEAFLNYIIIFFASKYAESYATDLSIALAEMGILRRLKAIIYLGAQIPRLTTMCLSCAGEILTYLAKLELDPETWPKGLKGFRSDLIEGLAELSDDPTHWCEIFNDSHSSEIATTSLLVYEYFEMRAMADLKYSSQNMLPYLIEFILSLPDPRCIHKIVLKTLWYLFARNFLSTAREEQIHGSNLANTWLLSALVNSNVADVYTHDISLVLWSFIIPSAPSKLISDILLLWLSKGNFETDSRLKPLIQRLPEARLILIDIIRTNETEIMDSACDLLLDATYGMDQLEESSKMIWDSLTKLLNDKDAPAKNTIALLRIGSYCPVSDVPIQTILHCIELLAEMFEGCFDISTTREILFEPQFRKNAMRLINVGLCECNNRADHRAFKKIISSARFLTAIDLNTLSQDQEVAIASWELLTIVSNLQKSSGTVELPMHPTRLLKIWAKTDNPNCTTVSVRLATSALNSESPTPMISVRWGRDPNIAVKYAQSVSFVLQWLCTKGFGDAWHCLSALNKHCSQSSLLVEPMAKFHLTQNLIRAEINKGVSSLVPSFLIFLNTWFDLIAKMDKRTNFIQERANDPLRIFSNCLFSHMFDRTLDMLSRVLVHDQTSHLDKESRKLIATIERFILQHKNALKDDLVQDLQRHCTIIDI